jgi:hypothetical protein
MYFLFTSSKATTVIHGLTIEVYSEGIDSTRARLMDAMVLVLFLSISSSTLFAARDDDVARRRRVVSVTESASRATGSYTVLYSSRSGHVIVACMYSTWRKEETLSIYYKSQYCNRDL